MRKKLLLRLCLILMVALTISSCRTDQLPENETAYNNNSKFQLTSKRISLDEAKHKEQLLPELEKAESGFKNIKTNVFGKIINYGNGVSIDTDDVMYIEKGSNIHTYTFHINRENNPADAPVENLVLSNLPDGTYRELLVSYNFTLQEKQMLENGIPVDAKGKVSITELAQGTYNNGEMMTESTTSCSWVPETLWNPCSSREHDGSNANECEFINDFTKGTPPTAYVVMNYKCQLIASTALGDDGTGGGSGPQNGPGGLGGNEEPEIPTIPIISGGPNRITPCQKLNNLFDPTKANIKTLITGGMYNYINNSSVGEAGIYLKKDANGAYINEVAPYTGTNSLPPKFGGDYYPTIHTHPKSTYPMFSYSDLTVMYKLEMDASSHNRRLSSFLLVCEDDNGVKQTYAVVFESTGLLMEEAWSTPELAGCSIKQKIEALDEKLRLAYDNELLKTDSDPNYQPNYERVFLQFCFGTNIGLYKADNNLSSWSKLTIATNSDTATVTPTNCN